MSRVSGSQRKITEAGKILPVLDEYIQNFQKDNNPLGYFAAVYRGAIAKQVQALESGKFRHPDLIGAINCAFASGYFQTLDLGLEGKLTQRTWQLVFRAASRDKVSVIQHLALSLNARVNLDLPVTISESCSTDQLATLEQDFKLVNHLLVSRFTALSTSLNRIYDFSRLPLGSWIHILPMYDSVSGLLDMMARNLWQAVFGEARREAWKRAIKLKRLPEERREFEIDKLDRQLSRLSDWILPPAPLIAMIPTTLDQFERGTIGQKIGILLEGGQGDPVK